MPELTDDQLDGLFRKSAEEFDPPYDPAAWQDMKTRLDTKDHTMPAGAQAWKNLLRWGLPALLLLLIGGGWYAYDKAHTVTDKPVSSLAVGHKAVLKSQPDQSGRLVTSQSDVAESTGNQIGSPESAGSPKLTDATVKKQPTNDAEPVENMGKSKTLVSEPAFAKNGKSAFNAGEPAIGKLKKPETKTGEVAVRSTVKNAAIKGATKRAIPAYGLKTEPVRVSRSQAALAAPTLIARKATTDKQRLDRNISRGGRLSDRKPGNRVRVSDLGVVSTTSNTVPPARSVNNPRVTANPDWVDVMTSGTPGFVTTPELTTDEPAQWLTITELASRPAHWPQPLTFRERPILMQPDTATAVRRVVSVPSTSERGLSVRLVVAPDLSTVGLKNFSRPGTNFGVLLEYRFAPRWSVQAGVIQSTKVYKALGSEYVVPYGMWVAPFKIPESVDGRCNMLDIPINVRYDLAILPRIDGRQPSRWFVSGGLTTYIMNKEDYHYNYPPHTYNQKTDWSTSTGAYGFSNLNLSIGYEQSLSKRLSWQVEPFMKVPLKGVGYFKIDLLSTGAFFSLRYKL